MIIIIEGIDNSGKTTLINNSVEELNKKGSTSIILNDETFHHYKSLAPANRYYYVFSTEDKRRDNFYFRNMLLLEIAKAYEKSKAYDYIFIDRCFLSFCVYNAEEDKQDYLDLIKDYFHIILYQKTIEAKENEFWTIEQLEKQQNEFLGYNLPNHVKVDKGNIRNIDISCVSY